MKGDPKPKAPRKPAPSHSAAAALDVISRVLEPLPPESRARVMRSAGVFFGIDLTKPDTSPLPVPAPTPEPSDASEV
jgi:hypothetical protein